MPKATVATAKATVKTKTVTKAKIPAKEKGRTAAKKPVPGKGGAVLSAEARYRMVAEAAYFRAEQRGFVGGDPSQDWAEAEAEIAATLGKRK